MIASRYEGHRDPAPGSTGASRLRLGLATFGFAVAASITVAEGASDGANHGGAFPWTLVPTPVDRSHEERPRLPDRIEPTPRPNSWRLEVDRFPKVAADASFSAEGRRWRIRWVVLRPGADLCETPDGRRWGCGLRALAQLSGRLAGARLRCRPVEDASADIPAIECFRHGRSIALGLLSDGWAEPTPDAPPDHLAVHREAVAAERGLWSATVPP